MPQSDKPQVDSAEESSRPQRAGEAGTTRFGMEDGDNTDVSATGGPVAHKEEQ